MRILKGIVKIFFWLVIVAFLVMPVWFIYEISNEEMEAYEPPKAPVLQETAYGSIEQSYRTNVYETISVSGTFISDTYAYMELKQEDLDIIRWDVNVGDEIQEGQVLGTYKGEAVTSTVTGILVSNHSYGEDAYLKVQLFSPLKLECYLTDEIVRRIQRNGVELTTEQGEAVEVVYVSVKKNGSGMKKVQFSIESESYDYEQNVQDFKLFTGSQYLKTLVLDEDCVYQKEVGEDKPWYVRQTTKEGKFIKEVEVTVGYQSDGVVCISGIEEGEYFDSGYKAIVGKQ